MSCGCSSGSSNTVASKAIYTSQTVVSNVDCPYNDTNLLDFKNRLVWFKNNGLYIQYNISASLLNKYIGTVISSMNISEKCTYKQTLDDVSELVNFIITLQ
jgi:hypothetical protein